MGLIVPPTLVVLLPVEAKNVAGAHYALAQPPAAGRSPSLLSPLPFIEAIHAFRNVTLRQTWTSTRERYYETP